MRLTRDLVVPTAWAARLPLVAAGPALAVGLVLLIGLDDEPAVEFAAVVGMLLTAAGVGHALDDPAANVLASSPTSLLARRTVRVGLALAVVGVGWVVVLEAMRTLPGGDFLPTGDLMLELAGFVGMTLTLSVLASRITDGPGGTIAALALVPTVALMAMLVNFHGSWPIPTVMPGVHPDRWWWVIGVSLAVFVWTSLDPARPRARAALVGG